MNYFEFIKNRLNLDEALITFGGKAYPKFGQIVILAGGAGSGKGFVSSNLLGIEGNTLDVDQLKKLVIGSEKLASKIKDETGRDIKGLDLSKPDNVSMLHDILSSVYGITKANEKRIFAGALAAPPDRKPNLIFDVTLKDLTKLASITRNVMNLGYEKDNIHLVWVVNDITVAMKQNKERTRVVPEEVLVATHEGASLTMNKILSMGDNLKKYMNGDIWLAFNKAGVDTSLVKSKIGKGMYIKKSNYIQVKKKGKAQISLNDMEADIITKIASYVPKTDTWEMALGRKELSENIEGLFDTVQELLEAVELHKKISIGEDTIMLTMRNKNVLGEFEAVYEGNINSNQATFYIRKNGIVKIIENKNILPQSYHIYEFFDGVIAKYDIDEYDYIKEQVEI